MDSAVAETDIDFAQTARSAGARVSAALTAAYRGIASDGWMRLRVAWQNDVKGAIEWQRHVYPAAVNKGVALLEWCVFRIGIADHNNITAAVNSKRISKGSID